MKTRILITGASGFLGSELVKFLPKSYVVMALVHRKSLVQPPNNVKVIHGDINNISFWKKELLGVDVVIHLAGITHSKNMDLYKKINTRATIDLIDSCEKHGI